MIEILKDLIWPAVGAIAIVFVWLDISRLRYRIGELERNQTFNIEYKETTNIQILNLEQDLDDLHRFLTDPEFAKRVKKFQKQYKDCQEKKIDDPEAENFLQMANKSRSVRRYKMGGIMPWHTTEWSTK